MVVARREPEAALAAVEVVVNPQASLLMNDLSFHSETKTCDVRRGSLRARNLAAVLSLALVTWLPAPLSAAEAGQTFATPEAAVAALSAAVSATNRTAHDHNL